VVAECYDVLHNQFLQLWIATIPTLATNTRLGLMIPDLEYAGVENLKNPNIINAASISAFGTSTNITALVH